MNNLNEQPKVGIVLVNYNGEKFQQECIESINNMAYKNIEIIVVDNGSTDNSIDILKKKYPSVTIIETKENLGIAVGNNIGIEKALKNNSEYVLLLNNDTELDEYLLSNLMEKAEEKIIVVPKIYYFNPSSIIWYGGGKLNLLKGMSYHLHIDENDSEDSNIEKVTRYSPTCCMLIHKNVFSNIGLMDEKYFMYYDDVDFCQRLYMNGYKLLYVPKAKLWHKVSSSSGGIESSVILYYSIRNRLYFIEKFGVGNRISKQIVINYISFIKLIKIFIWRIQGNKKRANIVYKAVIDYYKGNLKKQDF